MPNPSDVDWTDHAVTLAGWLAGLVGALGALCIYLIRTGMERRDKEMLGAIAALQREVLGLREDNTEKTAGVLERIRAAEIRLAEAAVRCDSYHARRVPWTDAQRRQILSRASTEEA